jgi:hypothetical protein
MISQIGRNTMKSFKNMARITAAIAFVALFIGTLGAQAQSGKEFEIGKKGQVHFYIPLKVGRVVLQPGMYQVQHSMEGGDHILGFKEVEMPAGYRHGNTQVAKEAAARIKCKVEPVAKKADKTIINLRTNNLGEKEIADVQVAGEAFKHLL